MTIREAAEEWGRKKDNSLLYNKTRRLLEKGFETLDFDKATSFYTLRDLQTALAYSSINNQEDKAKAASLMWHILRYAYDKVPNQQHGITFTYNDMLRYKPVVNLTPNSLTPNPSPGRGENGNDNENESQNKTKTESLTANRSTLTEIQPSSIRPQPSDANEPALLCLATNEELLEEIKRRGWKGKFQYMVTVEL